MLSMKRSFLLLQGPVGPFFRTLGTLLKEKGQRVTRVNFNGGDAYDWRGPGAINLRERARDWPEYFFELTRKYEITDLVTFGDCRPQLRAATKVARSQDIRCHVFEEGYIRPDWITLEDFGVNGHSLMPKSPEWYLEIADQLPDELLIIRAPCPMRVMMMYSIAYNIAKFSAQPLFPFFRNHRPYSERKAVMRWSVKTVEMKRKAREDYEFQKRFLASGRKFFLFCLQLGSDYQIRSHSPFENMDAAISTVLRSYAHNLPQEANLLVKSHPMELWPAELEILTMDLAKKLEIEKRVFFTTGGFLTPYIRASEGMIIVNSTAGMASLEHNRPTIALGTAIYDLPGLTYGEGLDNFWTRPAPPDFTLFSAFKKVLVHQTQINGNFYTSGGIQLALPKVASRLMDRPNGVKKTY